MTYETLLKQNAKMAFDNSFTITHVEDLVNSIKKSFSIIKKNYSFVLPGNYY